MDTKALKKQADKLFEKKSSLDGLHQTIAEQFYPTRADFTGGVALGAEVGIDLMTSYPVLCRRDLGDSFASLLRQDEWFETSVNHEEDLDQDGKRWLERATSIQRNAMADRVSRFDRATKEADHDFAAFGQCVVSVELNRARDALLYRCVHLRDVAWCENDEGEIDFVARKWKPYARDLIRMFPNSVSQQTKTAAEKDPYTEIDVLHVVSSSLNYGDAKFQRMPFVSVFMEAKDAHPLEERGVYNRIYVIPRWMTISGSQYAYSPAAIVALPDARLIQSMTGVLLEAGEKAVNPPMLARSEVIRSDVAIYPGGITWTDAEHDVRMGEPLKLLTNDKGGIPLGLDMQQDVRAMLREAFFLNKLTMPQPGPKMTAYEVGQRVSEWVRQSLPLFRPVEVEYNGLLCDATFDLLFRAGAFGPLNEIPRSLSNEDIRFKFKTPLREAESAKHAVALQKSRELLNTVMDIDGGAKNVVNFRDAYRKAVEGVGMAAEFIRDKDEADAISEQEEQQVATAQLLEQAQAGGAAAESLANANKTFSETA